MSDLCGAENCEKSVQNEICKFRNLANDATNRAHLLKVYDDNLF